MIEQASASAANPIESALRAIAMQAGFMRRAVTRLTPQHAIDLGSYVAHADLAAPGIKLAVEAEGFAWHGDLEAMENDCRRHTGYACEGWTLVRYTWRNTMYQQNYVGDSLVSAANQLLTKVRKAPLKWR